MAMNEKIVITKMVQNPENNTWVKGEVEKTIVYDEYMSGHAMMNNLFSLRVQYPRPEYMVEWVD